MAEYHGAYLGHRQSMVVTGAPPYSTKHISPFPSRRAILHEYQSSVDFSRPRAYIREQPRTIICVREKKVA